MTATQVRSRFHALIDRVENTERLKQMYDALADVEGLPDEITDELTPEQRQRLERSLEQVKRGETWTHEEVMAKAKQWLTK
jgi:predicted transcriptional regulator